METEGDGKGMLLLSCCQGMLPREREGEGGHCHCHQDKEEGEGVSTTCCCCPVVGACHHVIVAMWERMREREGEGCHRCQDRCVDGRCCVSSSHHGRHI